jgi:16S rRNA (cytosine967-C5)-methyltransferase
MRDGGKIAAAITVLQDVLSQRTPVKEAVRDWGKKSRFAGAKDRAWISGLVLDALRRKNSIEHQMEATGSRALAIGALKAAWGWDVRKIEEAFKDEHAPAALSSKEREALLLAPDPSAPPHVRGDYPEWLGPHMARAFGPDAVIEAQAMANRAPVDLRANTLKSDAEKVGRALEGRSPSSSTVSAFRRPTPSSAAKASKRSRPIRKAGSKCRTWAARSRQPPRAPRQESRCWTIAPAAAARPSPWPP